METAMAVIDQFKGEFEFLSNFYRCQVFYDGYWYVTLEHAFQAAKNPSWEHQDEIRRVNKPGVAKRIGRRCELRPDWEEVKDELMWHLLLSKFSDSNLAKKLLEIRGVRLIEGNTWHDNYWGDCICGREACKEQGKNKLGTLLEDLRAWIFNYVWSGNEVMRPNERD
jgi:ribA/ribD-fused uncharacterized protein